jgi:2,6-dihydroxypseudooxynicotine hydrolase
LYVVAGTRDRLCTPDEQRRLAAEAKGEVVLSVIEGGDHVVHNLHYRYRSQTVDWLVEYLR